jgi:dipeptidase
MTALAAVTAHGQTLFAKNSDRPANECQPLVQHERRSHPPGTMVPCQFVPIPQVSETLRHVGSRPYWCWGYEHGFNECQVVIGNEALPSPVSFTEPKLIGMELLRLGLERGRSAAEAVEVMTDLVTRYGQGRFENDAGVRTYDNGYIIADPREAFVLETAGHQWAVKQVRASVGISNVYSIGSDWDRLSPDAESFAASRGMWPPAAGASGEDRFPFAQAYTNPEYQPQATGSGSRRRARSCAVLGQRAGGIDVPTMIALLSDHSDGEQPGEPFRTNAFDRGGICVHDNEKGTGGNTAASLVADLCADRSRLPVYWCSFYSPCLGIFLPFFSEGTLPPVLAQGAGAGAPQCGAGPVPGRFGASGSERQRRGPVPGVHSEESPWWLFYRLAHLAAQEPEVRVPLIRQRWAGLQAELFESAPRIATDAQRLLNRGEGSSAERLLTEYMACNVETALSIAGELIRTMEAEGNRN